MLKIILKKIEMNIYVVINKKEKINEKANSIYIYSLFMVGCSSTRPHSKSDVPKWYLNPPKDKKQVLRCWRCYETSIKSF